MFFWKAGLEFCKVLWLFFSFSFSYRMVYLVECLKLELLHFFIILNIPILSLYSRFFRVALRIASVKPFESC